MVAKRKDRADESLVLRGTLYVLRRKCGKANCRCADGDPHESPALAYPAAGTTKTLTLSDAEADLVREALQRYDRAKAELDAAAEAGMAALRQRISARR